MAPLPFITIIIATRNAVVLLPRCLESIRAQLFRGFECVVIDGASTDGTVELLARSSDVVTHWRSEPDNGIFSAWNKGVKLARGEWICFLGGDDRFWDAQVLERLVPHLRSALPQYRVVYGRNRVVDSQGELIEEQGVPWEQFKGRFLSFTSLPHPGLMQHRSLFDQHGLFDERFRMAGDYEFLLRELKTRDALFVPLVNVNVEHGGITSSPENYLQLLAESRDSLARHGLRPPRLMFAYWKTCAWAYVRIHAIVGDRVARRFADIYRVVTLRKTRHAGKHDRRYSDDA